MSTWSTAERDTLKSAIASGILTVTYDGPPRRSVTYQSLDAMKALLRDMETSIERAAGRPRYSLIATRKGL